MSVFSRTDRSILGQWWWTVDRMLLAGVALLIGFGILMVFAASPPVAQSINLPESHFIIKHLIYLAPAAFFLLGVSILAPLGVLRLAVGMTGLFAVLVVAVLIAGPEIKGAKRWLFLFGSQLQPSEFLKPALAVVAAWLLTRSSSMSGWMPASVLVCAVIGLLILQPDLGMATLVAAVFCAQLFVAGLPWLLVIVFIGLGISGIWGAYQWLPHVRTRIDSFLDPTAEVYQVQKAMNAVSSGGLWGRGPGEGVVKFRLPEAHSDFVFATTAEEFGLIACLIIVIVFALIVARSLMRAHNNNDRFTQLAAAGLVVGFGLQALINMAVNLNVMPTKGMTLPFISYGGSSMLALAVGMGMLLALTRRGAKLDRWS